MPACRRAEVPPLSRAQHFRIALPSGEIVCMHRLLGILLIAAFASGGAAPILAQDASQWRAPRWVGDVTFLSSNALLGGLTAGVAQSLRGGDFRDGFARGALGGATAYVGRRVAAEGFDGAGLLGRQVSSVGASMVRNASEGRPTLETLVFAFTPVRFHVDRSEGWQVSPKVNLRDLFWLASFALRSETEFDLSMSLSAGAPVFRSPMRSFVDSEGVSVDGIQTSGVIGLSDVPDEMLRTAFAHERVHVLQHDFALLIWSDPVEARLMGAHPITARLYRHVEPGVVFPGLRRLAWRTFRVEHSKQPAEIEAMFLDRRPR